MNQISSVDQMAAQRAVQTAGIEAEVACAIKGDLVYKEVTLTLPAGSKIVGTSRVCFKWAAEDACRKAIKAGWVTKKMTELATIGSNA